MNREYDIFSEGDLAEIRPENASDFIRGFAGHPGILKNTLQVGKYRDNPGSQQMEAILRTGSGEYKISADIYDDPEREMGIRESFTAEIGIPLRKIRIPDDLYTFREEFSRGWQEWLDRDPQSKKSGLTWKTHKNATTSENGAIGLLIRKEKAGYSVYLRFNEEWPEHKFNPKERDGQNSRQYAAGVAEKMVNLTGTVEPFLQGFLKKIPDLIRTRAERVKNKKPDWPVEAMKRLGVKQIESTWFEPEFGIEPLNFGAYGPLVIDGEQYHLAVHTRSENTANPSNAGFTVYIYPPEEIQTRFAGNPDDASNQLNAFFRQLDPKKPVDLTVFDYRDEEGVQPVDLHFEIQDIKSDTGIQYLFCLSLNLGNLLMYYCQDKKISGEQLLKKVVEKAKILHPYLLDYSRRK
jgi:hypothetical protein